MTGFISIWPPGICLRDITNKSWTHYENSLLPVPLAIPEISAKVFPLVSGGIKKTIPKFEYMKKTGF